MKAMLSRDAVIAKARAVGFDLCGIASAEPHPRLARLSEWVAQGRAGTMTWLAESLDERLDPRRVLPSARSVISVGVVYNTAGASESSSAETVTIARYARGADYHDVVQTRLRQLLQWLADEHGPGLEAFSCVDAGPIQERVFAEAAGLGWIGKNTCVINPDVGSWIFLAEIICSLPLDCDEPALDQCGTCTLCIEACPTHAIVAPGVLDSTRCISYLTIELKGDAPAALAPAMGNHVYGCDICQEVCPWNASAAVSHDPSWQPRRDWDAVTTAELASRSDEALRSGMRGSAMRRSKVAGLRRNVAIALENGRGRS
jgi:epoxyqueuosine reductase